MPNRDAPRRRNDARNRQTARYDDDQSHWIDRTFDRVERYPRAFVNEYRRLVFYSRVEGAVFVILLLAVLYLLADRLRTAPQPPGLEPVLRQIKTN